MFFCLLVLDDNREHIVIHINNKAQKGKHNKSNDSK